MNPLQAPEMLAYSRSAKIAGTARNGVTVPVPPVPPPYRAERAGTPGQTWITERAETNRRAAKPQPCPTCGASTLTGPDDDRCSLTARVDPTPATLLEEVVARLGGRHSYELIRQRLYHRDEITIRARRANYTIVLDHQCEMTVLF